jgi:hypothetical protein
VRPAGAWSCRRRNPARDHTPATAGAGATAGRPETPACARGPHPASVRTPLAREFGLVPRVMRAEIERLFKRTIGDLPGPGESAGDGRSACP